MDEMDLVPTGRNLVSQFICRKFEANLNFISDKQLVKKEGGSGVWLDGTIEQSVIHRAGDEKMGAQNRALGHTRSDR